MLVGCCNAVQSNAVSWGIDSRRCVLIDSTFCLLCPRITGAQLLPFIIVNQHYNKYGAHLVPFLFIELDLILGLTQPYNNMAQQRGAEAFAVPRELTGRVYVSCLLSAADVFRSGGTSKGQWRNSFVQISDLRVKLTLVLDDSLSGLCPSWALTRWGRFLLIWTVEHWRKVDPSIRTHEPSVVKMLRHL